MALESLDPHQIAKGIKAMIASGKYSEYPPNPMAFRAMCLPTGEDMGLPSESEAFAQAVGNRTSKHPSVVLTLCEYVDPHALRRASEKDAAMMWAKAWAKTVEHVAAGGALPEIKEEVEHKPVKADPEAVQSHRESLRSMFSDTKNTEVTA